MLEDEDFAGLSDDTPEGSPKARSETLAAQPVELEPETRRASRACEMM